MKTVDFSDKVSYKKWSKQICKKVYFLVICEDAKGGEAWRKNRGDQSAGLPAYLNDRRENYDEKKIHKNVLEHDPASSLLIGCLKDDDIIKLRVE